jgi:hypothetical protein
MFRRRIRAFRPTSFNPFAFEFPFLLAVFKKAGGLHKFISVFSLNKSFFGGILSV